MNVAPTDWTQVNWADPASPISRWFTVNEATFQPSLGRPATAADGFGPDQQRRLYEFFNQFADVARDFFNAPVVVHVGYRCPTENQLAGGASASAHLADGEWAAFDFNVVGLECDAARQQILAGGMLNAWKLRMEDRPGSDWVHLGSDWGRGSAFFIP